MTEIEIKNKRSRFTFGDIQRGSCFIADGELFIRLVGDEDYQNAVSVGDGFGALFDDTDEVDAVSKITVEVE